MRVAVAADHRGRAFKERIAAYLVEQGHHVLDMGTHSSKSCDYTDMAYTAARAVVEGKADIGTVYRLQALAGDASGANDLCSRLKAAGVACQVKN